MASTPNVVPAASRVFWPHVTVAIAVGAWRPRIATKASIVAITARLLRTGAYIWAAKRRFAVSRPAATAPMP